jgi:hypothetical protein
MIRSIWNTMQRKAKELPLGIGVIKIPLQAGIKAITSSEVVAFDGVLDDRGRPSAFTEYAGCEYYMVIKKRKWV